MWVLVGIEVVGGSVGWKEEAESGWGKRGGLV